MELKYEQCKAFFYALHYRIDSFTKLYENKYKSLADAGAIVKEMDEFKIEMIRKVVSFKEEIRMNLVLITEDMMYKNYLKYLLKHFKWVEEGTILSNKKNIIEDDEDCVCDPYEYRRYVYDPPFLDKCQIKRFLAVEWPMLVSEYYIDKEGMLLYEFEIDKLTLTKTETDETALMPYQPEYALTKKDNIVIEHVEPTHRETIFARNRYLVKTGEAEYWNGSKFLKENGNNGNWKQIFPSTDPNNKTKYREPNQDELPRIIILLEGTKAQKIAINELATLLEK